MSINASDGHMAYIYEMYDDKKGANCTDVFNFRITDSDGDEKTSTFTVNTRFNEDYDPNLVYDPANIQPIVDEIAPDEECQDSTDEENPAEDAAEATGDNPEAKKQDGALPSDVAPENDAKSTIPDDQDVINADNRDEAQSGDGESPEQNADDSSKEADKPILEDIPENETPETESSEKATDDDMEASGGKPGEEKGSEEDVQEHASGQEDRNFPEEAGSNYDNASGDGEVSGTIGDELDKLFAENGFKVAKAEPKATKNEDLPELSLVDGDGNVDISAFMAGLRESVESPDNMVSPTLKVIEPEDEPSKGFEADYDAPDDAFEARTIESTIDTPLLDACQDAEISVKVMAEAGA